MSNEPLFHAARAGIGAAIWAMVFQAIDRRVARTKAYRTAMRIRSPAERLGYHVGRIISLLRH